MEVASCVSLRCVTEPFVVAHNSALLHSMTTTKPPIINTTDTPEIIQIQVRVFSIKLNPPLTPNSQMETFTSSDAPSEAVTASDQIKTNSYVWRHVIFVVYVLSGFPSVGVVRVGEIQVQEESLRIWDLRPEVFALSDCRGSALKITKSTVALVFPYHSQQNFQIPWKSLDGPLGYHDGIAQPFYSKMLGFLTGIGTIDIAITYANSKIPSSSVSWYFPPTVCLPWKFRELTWTTQAVSFSVNSVQDSEYTRFHIYSCSLNERRSHFWETRDIEIWRSGHTKPIRWHGKGKSVNIRV